MKRRTVLALLVAVIAVLIAPAAFSYAPINSADLIVFVAPIAIVVIMWPALVARRSRADP
ncbi:hypothetical protein [Microbacterium lacus]|uniref:hypothetical protein n=1 Tax=Microbacterium lacus TaxID=415217 RepID=UPI000C2BA1C6|nr:hypothetical protein [Microbacterium lacus]